MKKNFWLVIALFLSSFLFMSFSPSLDGRAVVADEGVLPKGIFAKTVGYLPGDSISVTNLNDKTTVDILVIGALDPSEGVAILLSPEAAELLGISKNSVVKITKRAGQADEAVAGTAVIGNSTFNDEGEDSEEDGLTPPSYDDEEMNKAEPAPVPAEDENKNEEAPLSTPLVSSEENEESSETEEEKTVAEPVVTAPVVSESENEIEEAEEAEPEPEPAAEPEKVEEEKIVRAEPVQTKETVKEPEPVVSAPSASENDLSERVGPAVNNSSLEEKIENAEPGASEDPVAERITADGEVYMSPRAEPEHFTDSYPVFFDDEIVAERVTPDKLEEMKDKTGPEGEVEQNPYQEEDVPENYDSYLEKLRGEKMQEEIYAEKVTRDNVDEFGNVFDYNDAPIEVTNQTEEDLADDEPVTEDNVPEESEELEEPESSVEKEPEAAPAVEKSESVVKAVEEPETESDAPIVLVPAEEKPPVAEKEEHNVEVQAAPVPEKTPEPKEEVKPVETVTSTKVLDFGNYIKESLKDLKSGSYYIQIGVYSDKSNIQSIFDKYLGKYPIVLVPLKSGAGYQVMIGPLNVDEYGTVLQRFRSYGFKDAFLRKIK